MFTVINGREAFTADNTGVFAPTSISGSGWVEILRLPVPDFDRVRLDCAVSAASLSDLKVTSCADVGGTALGHQQDTVVDFSQATNILIDNNVPLSGSAVSAPAGSLFRIVLNTSSDGEISLWAKGNGASVSVRARMATGK